MAVWRYSNQFVLCAIELHCPNFIEWLLFFCTKSFAKSFLTTAQWEKKYTLSSSHHQCHHRSRSATMDKTRVENNNIFFPCELLTICCSHVSTGDIAAQCAQGKYSCTSTKWQTRSPGKQLR